MYMCDNQITSVVYHCMLLVEWDVFFYNWLCMVSYHVVDVGLVFIDNFVMSIILHMYIYLFVCM